MEQPRPIYRLAVSAVRGFLRIFFHEVEVTGLEHVPSDRGGIFISWHPNALIDPALILARSPRSVVFGARHGLFRWPLLGWLMHALGTVPIYRAADVTGDAEERRAANRKSLDALAERIASGTFSALFPEGVSHDEPHLVELKTGAARLYYRARELQGVDPVPPAIVPVGLHYDKKLVFRSRALVWFHRPLELPQELDRTPEPGESPEVSRERARRLTGEIERELQEVIHATEDWETHRLLNRGRKLVRAERAHRAKADPGKPGVTERALGFARLRTGYYRRLAVDPAGVAALRERVRRYDDELCDLRIEDHHLDRNPRLFSPWLLALLALQALVVFLLLPPLLIVGILFNGPAALLTLGLSHRFAAKKEDLASLKLLIGALFFPLGWMASGFVGYRAHRQLHEIFPAMPDTPSLAGLLTAAIVVTGGILSVRYLRIARETLTSIRVRLTRAGAVRTLARLRRERGKLYDRFVELTAGMELPGSVAEDGSLRQE